jgi:hypothetical protein
MTASLDTFWWLLAVVAGAVAVFAVLLWLRLTRRADQERRAEDRREGR